MDYSAHAFSEKLYNLQKKIHKFITTTLSYQDSLNFMREVNNEFRNLQESVDNYELSQGEKDLVKKAKPLYDEKLLAKYEKALENIEEKL